LICTTIGELKAQAEGSGTSGVLSRALILTVGQLEPNLQLTWAQWTEVCVRRFYENSPALDVLMAVGGKAAVQEVGQMLANLPDIGEMPEDQEIPTFVIGLADDIWWTWTGANAFYHAGSGDKINHLGRAPLQQYSVDVVVLWYRCLAELAQFRDEQNAANANEESAGEVRPPASHPTG